MKIDLTKEDHSTKISVIKGSTQLSLDNAIAAAREARDTAEAHKDSADTSATSASGSAATATSQATIATTKASEASTSASSASTSATMATTKASEASTSATNASASETNASTSETNAATSASNALDYATDASLSETNAAGSATSASASATSASTSATSASSSATTATTQAGIATTKAGEASTSAANAATSETNAGVSAATATTKAAEADASAQSASASATLTAGHLASIETIYDNFDDRYLGDFASDPTLDNDGNALQIGAMYFNTTVNNTKFYNGTAWEDPEATATQAAATATTKASEASVSVTNAATSEANAATSEANASTSATNAAASASAAATSAANALASENAAELAETNAESAETSAVAANTSALAAQSAAQSAQTSAETAQTAAEAAQASASASANSATASATSAGLSATNAASSETDAETAATAAASSATAASSSATSASTSATTATTQAGIATTKATEASTSATNAATSETNASVSATSAAISEANALTYKGAAEAARDSALAALDSFDDRYLGVKSSDPTVDNDGNPLVGGALYYFDDGNPSTEKVMKVYEGSTWVAAYASLSGALLQSNNLSDLTSVGMARTNLGLGTAATTNSTAYEPADATILKGADIGSTVQSYDINTVIDGSYIHTDNNYTTAEKSKLTGVADNANNYSLPTASGTTLGGVKSGTDITVDASGNVSVNDDSHNHTIANVDGLQTALDGKVDDSQVLTDVPAGAVFTDTVYTHPTYAGDDFSVDTGPLTGATVVSDIDFNVTTDTLGHVTDANATVSTRNLTAGDIGAEPADNTILKDADINSTVQGYDAHTVVDDLYVRTDNNYTTTEKSKLAGIEDNSNNYSHPSSHPASMITTVDEFANSNSANVQDVLDDLDSAISGKQDSGTYNTIIGTDTDIAYTGATVLSTMTMTDGVIQGHTSRTLTLANLGYTGETNATADQTASEILTAIKTVDGSGSGLDADTVDGIQGNDIFGAYSQVESNLDTLTTAQTFGWSTSTTGRPESYGQGLQIVSSSNTYNGSNNWTTQLGFGTSQNQAYFRGKTNAGAWGPWHKIWNSGNDGSGSGLDADTLDGVQASSFLRSDADDTATGSIRFTNANNYFGSTGSNTAEIWMQTGNAGSPQIAFTDNQGDMSWAIGGDDADNSFKIHGSASGTIPTINSLATPYFEITTSGTTIINGTCNATSFIGDGSGLTGIEGVPSGVITMWSGSSANIPSGWYLCDGTNGTPNLIGRFIKGATSSGATGGSNTTSTSGSHSHTTSNHTLSTSQIPSHNHSITDPTGSSYPNVSQYDVIHRTQGSNQYFYTNNTGGSGSHNHGNTGTNGSHSHTVEPPYYEICYIMKG